ncbi:Non-classical phosphatidylinositol transfer protein (PITP) [Datura stramonium]|uniref:Non-classical phosphatidylinositol transfer protein (PITP) n=1 Tax=Datura stramonium TaxID=4076 RepID=A0ABS8TFH7_DATST|nr:Non-classical phosphatidylinositol transfer protein (PITP) [Datura stramonium]
MTVEVQSEATQVAEVVVPQEELETSKKVVEEVEENEKVKEDEEEAKPNTIEKSSSYREESNFLSDLKENEKKALNELKSKVEEAILGNTLFKKEETSTKKSPEKSGEGEEKKDDEHNNIDCQAGEEERKDEENPDTNGGNIEEKEEEKEKEGGLDVNEVDREISIWGVPLLPSKGDEKTNVVLLKFLRARDYKVNESFEMLKKTLQWRKDFKIQSILEEDLGSDLAPAAYMSGIDNQGHPICYNIFGVLDDEELYHKTFGTEEKRNQFLRWRVQLMEKGIQQLDFKAGGVSSLLQINDLKNSPGPSKKEVRVATKQAVHLLQDNYPEFVAKNIFINVPFWYYAVHSLLSPFLTQRTKSKFVFARPAKVTETLLKYIPIHEIPIQYGGLKRENDFEFDCEASEILLKAGSTETIEIPAVDVESTFIWDVTIVGGEVSYKEEFVPEDETSYTIIIQKDKKVSSPIRNTFKNTEAGKVVLTIKNSSSKKKKAFYRHKVKKSAI